VALEQASRLRSSALSSIRLVFMVLAANACSSSAGNGASGAGGQKGSGGISQQGGIPGSGGITGQGGAFSSGGGTPATGSTGGNATERATTVSECEETLATATAAAIPSDGRFSPGSIAQPIDGYTDSIFLNAAGDRIYFTHSFLTTTDFLGVTSNQPHGAMLPGQTVGDGIPITRETELTNSVLLVGCGQASQDGFRSAHFSVMETEQSAQRLARRCVSQTPAVLSFFADLILALDGNPLPLRSLGTGCYA